MEATGCNIDKSGCSYVPSKFNSIISLPGEKALAYNANKNYLSIWEADDIAQFNRVVSKKPYDRTSPKIKELVNWGYLVPSCTDELQDIKNEFQNVRLNQSQMILSIAPTLACNFGCDYCYQGRAKSSDRMSSNVMDEIVEFIGRSKYLEGLAVGWYGGEPTLQMRAIEKLSGRIMELCQSRSIPYDASMVSNGYMLTVKKAERLHKLNIRQIQVTLDGPAQTHDRRRYLRTGKPTFFKILKNLRQIVGNLPIHISIRVNIDERNAKVQHISKLLEVLVEHGLAQQPNLSVYFAPVEAITLDDIEQVAMAKERYAWIELELYRRALKIGLTQPMYPFRFHSMCAAIRPNGFVILPDGALHKCWDTVADSHKAVGSIFAPERIAENKVHQKWLDWDPFRNPECAACNILPACTGGCAMKTVHTQQLYGEASRTGCLTWRYTLAQKMLIFAVCQNVMPAHSLPSILRQWEIQEKHRARKAA